VSISASWEFCLKNSECCCDDLFAGDTQRHSYGDFKYVPDESPS